MKKPNDLPPHLIERMHTRKPSGIHWDLRIRKLIIIFVVTLLIAWGLVYALAVALGFKR